jgi:hypothetical protein
VLALDDPHAIVAFVLRHCDLPYSLRSPT